MKNAILILTYCVLYITGKADHLVGGFISYTKMNDTTYTLNLTLYRDCSSSTPFDITTTSAVSQIEVGIFNSSFTQLEGIITINTPPIVTDAGVDDFYNCLPLINNCYEAAKYSQVFTVADDTSSYILAWGRCCTPDAFNIYTPDGYGMLITATLVPKNQHSPTITTKPLFGINIYQKDTIAISATDADADSLAYDLQNMYCAGSNQSPMVYANDLIGADTVIWPNGFYPTKPFGYNSSFFSPSAGELECYVQVVGTYLVPFFVNEYRNGILIGRYSFPVMVKASHCTTASLGENKNKNIPIFLSQPKQIVTNEFTGTLGVYNIEGRLILEQYVTKNQIIDLINLKTGMYLCLLSTADQSSLIKFWVD
ncbi:MAG: T9SS type A sorting domain-containing protein [Chitinophagales bacterium]|nr:T9SS type A sorting domain-containing protein [Chitinophagales bacterium]